MKIELELSINDGVRSVHAHGPWDPETGTIDHTITLPKGASLALIQAAIVRSVTLVGGEFTEKLADFIAPTVEQPPVGSSQPTASCIFDENAPKPEQAGVHLAAVDGDSESMRHLFQVALESERDVVIDYTDREDKSTADRRVTPLRWAWRGPNQGTPSRAIIARHNGAEKTFYLYRIDRAELV